MIGEPTEQFLSVDCFLGENFQDYEGGDQFWDFFTLKILLYALAPLILFFAFCIIWLIVAKFNRERGFYK